MPSSEVDAAAELLERLLTDAGFRSRFRQGPAEACRDFGLDSLATELDGSMKAVFTLEARESKSSLAGVVMAAAAEGIGAFELSHQITPGMSPDAKAAVHTALSRTGMRAVSPHDPTPAGGAAAPAGAGGGAGAAGAGGGAGPAGGGTGVMPSVGAPAGAAPEHAGANGAGSAGGSSSAAASSANAGGGAAAAPQAQAPAAPQAAAAPAAAPAPAPASASASAPTTVAGGGTSDPSYASPSAPAAPSAPVAAPVDSAAVPAAPAAPAGAPGAVAPGAPAAPVVPGAAAAPVTPGTPATPAAVAGAAVAPGVPGAPAGAVVPGGPVAGGSAVFAAVPAPVAGASHTASFLPAVGAPAHADAAAAAPGGAGVDAAVGVPGNVPYPGDTAPKAAIAQWMASEAQKRGLPPQLPVMASLVESGLFNNPNQLDHDSVGYFQMRVGIWDEGPYKGFQGHPDLQVKWFLDQAESVQKQWIASGHSADLKNPQKFGDWIADVERPAAQYRGRYQLRLDDANGLLHTAAPAPTIPVTAPAGPDTAIAPGAPPAVAPGALLDPSAGSAAGGGSTLGASALQIAHSQLGFREIGSSNTGPQVNQYLAAAKVAPGNPWCASFVTWSLQHAGHQMPGGGWAAVSTWVHNAQAGTNNLHIVTPDQARPGDIVAYDWGGGNDFSSDGHIGFLASNVHGGQFTALEGNNGDAVSQVPRHLGGGPNVVFIRLDGQGSSGASNNIPTGPGANTPPPTPTPGAPATPAAVAAPGVPGAPAGAAASATASFAAIAQDRPHSTNTVQFMPAIRPQDAAAHAASLGSPAGATVQPAVDPAAAVGPGVTPGAPVDANGAASPADAAGVGGNSVVDMAGYPGDHAPKTEIAAWMSKEAEKHGLPGELPVMASLVESGLYNNPNQLDHDSVGYFQMRVGIWDEGPYKGFQGHPDLQLKWFLDQAEGVKRQWIAQGRGNALRDPSQYGEWIYNVERCAAEYRGRYQLRLGEARSLLRGEEP